jgi:hypothetical protein
MKTLFRSAAATLCLLALAIIPFSAAQTFPGVSGNPSAIARPAGFFYAPAFASQTMRVLIGNSVTGSNTITIIGAAGGIGGLQLPDGTTLQLQTVFNTLTPMIIDYGQANAEYVTPTAVSVGNCSPGNSGVGSTVQCATFTGTFSNTHGPNAWVVEGTWGVQTALNYAQQLGGGQVTIDPAWGQMAAGVPSITGGPASVNAILTGLVPMPLASVFDTRGSAPVYWNLQATQTAGSYLATPTTLTSSTVFSSTTAACTPVGSCYTGGTIHACIAYVDVMGNEGPCSGDYSFADTSAKAIQFTAPAASTGAVGWVPYVGLESGSASNEYNIPLVTQPTAIGAAPVSNGVCVLTTLETSIPACALANTTYNQSGSGAVAVVYPVVTSQQAFQLGGVSSTSYYAPNVIAHNAYSYEPGAHPGTPGLITQTGKATVSATLASTVPFVLGSVQIPPGFMNFVGREIQICGFVTDAATAVDTISAIQFWWDADGSNVTTGIPVKLANDQITATLTAAVNTEFCQNFVTTVASASATGGTIQAPFGWIAEGQIAAGTIHFMEPNITIAAVGSLNLADAARIDVVFVETTSTVDTPQLQNLTVTVVN